jgi:hypothetical protein
VNDLTMDQLTDAFSVDLDGFDFEHWLVNQDEVHEVTMDTVHEVTMDTVMDAQMWSRQAIRTLESFWAGDEDARYFMFQVPSRVDMWYCI